MKKVKPLTKHEQELLVAKHRAWEIQQKRRPLQESGWVESQHGTLTSQDRVISMGHYAKTSGQASQHYQWEMARKKRQENAQKKIVRVQKVG
jgi:hypothetical protein